MKKSINFWPFVGKDTYEAMELAKKAGFEGIELVIMAEGDLTPESTDEQLARIKEKADSLGIKIPSLVSGLCWGGYHPGHSRQRQRRVRPGKTHCIL